jgi:hypothetical protein
MSLRTLLLVLLLLNLVAFAGGRMGWLGHADLRGEPERLTNQIRPDAIEPGARPPAGTPPRASARTNIPPAADILKAEALAPASSSAESCTAFTVLGRAALAEVTTLAETHGSTITLSQQTLDEPANWRVRIPPAASVEAGEQRLAALQQRGVSDMYLIRGDGPNRWSLSLGLFSTEAAAEQRLETLRAQLRPKLHLPIKHVAPDLGLHHTLSTPAERACAHRLRASLLLLQLALPGELLRLRVDNLLDERVVKPGGHARIVKRARAGQRADALLGSAHAELPSHLAHLLGARCAGSTLANRLLRAHVSQHCLIRHDPERLLSPWEVPHGLHAALNNTRATAKRSACHAEG